MCFSIKKQGLSLGNKLFWFEKKAQTPHENLVGIEVEIKSVFLFAFKIDFFLKHSFQNKLVVKLLLYST